MENQSLDTVTPIGTITTAKPKTKSALLPVLIVLFVISYGLMCTLVIEQGSTIDAQRFLIRQLLGDSTQLNAMKVREQQKKQAEAKPQQGAPAQGNPTVQPNVRPDAQTPSSQAGSQPNNKGSRKTGKVRKPFPQKPPQDASEMADERRNLISI